MLSDQIISIDFGQGIDTKTDPKLVVPGKFTRLENGIFTKAKQLLKRNGYDSLPTTIIGGGPQGTNLVAPVMVKSFKDELVCADSGYLFSYSPSLLGWVLKGPYVSTEVTEKFIYQENSIGGYVDCAIVNGLAVYIWCDSPAYAGVNSTINTYAKVIDLATGDVLYSSNTPISTFSLTSNPFLSSSAPKCVVLGSSKLAITYLNSNAHLVMRILTSSTSGVSFGSEIDISGTRIDGPTTRASSVPYDVATTSSGMVISYPNQIWTVVNLKTYDTAGALQNSTTISEPDFNGPIYVCPDTSSGNLWVYWGSFNNTSGTGTLKYSVYSSTLASIVSATLVVSTPNSVSVYQISAIPLSSTQQTVLYTVNAKDTPSGATIDQTYQATVSSSGSVLTPFNFVLGARVVSRASFVNGVPYALFFYNGAAFVSTIATTSFPESISGNSQTFFLLNLLTGTVVARYAAGTAFSSNSTSGLGSTLMASNLCQISATKLHVGSAISFQFLSTPGSNQSISGLVGAAAITIDFNSANANRSTYADELLVLNGGVVSAYDGNSVSELGFHMPPFIASAFPSSSGGSIATGAYKYVACYQWTDIQGNVHQSPLSNIVTVTVSSGSSNSISLYVTSPYFSQKKGVRVVVFRTQSPGTLYYQVSDAIAVVSANSNQIVSKFTDTLADANLPGRQLLYTTGNVLSNDTPPPSMIMESHNNRLWLVDSENPNTIWYSKSFNPGNGLSLSGALIIQIDPKFGNITGLSEMDDKMVVFKEQCPFFFSGDGANDTGTGATLTFPQILPSDAGCNSLKSIILMRDGVLRMTTKGIYLLDRAMNDHYLGMEVEKYNAQKITSAELISDKNQIRFLTDSGVTLVFDYQMNQWSTFTNHQGYAATSWQGVYVYARTDGKVFKENTTSFLDNSTAYQVTAQTGWIALAQVQGLQRIRRIGLLGDYALGAGHGIQVSAAYDFGTTFSSPVAYSFAGTSGAYQYRERLPQQKCDAVQLLIQEITTGASGEYVNLTNMSFEAGMKRGMNKMSAAQSVG